VKVKVAIIVVAATTIVAIFWAWRGALMDAASQKKILVFNPF